MTELAPHQKAERRSLWLFRDLLVGQNSGDLFAAACREGRVERWGHAAQIPLWVEPEELILVIDGTIIARRQGPAEVIRLSRGDAFGKTELPGAPSSATTQVEKVSTNRETTICAIPRLKLQEICESGDFFRTVDAGRWPRKEAVQVPVWPLLGTMPTTRIARILLHLVENYGEVKDKKGRLPLTLRSRQLAVLAGLSKSRAGQVWRLFEGTGLVEVEGRSILLHDLDELRRYALG